MANAKRTEKKKNEDTKKKTRKNIYSKHLGTNTQAIMKMKVKVVFSVHSLHMFHFYLYTRLLFVCVLYLPPMHTTGNLFLISSHLSFFFFLSSLSHYSQYFYSHLLAAVFSFFCVCFLFFLSSSHSIVNTPV